MLLEVVCDLSKLAGYKNAHQNEKEVNYIYEIREQSN